MILPGKSQVVSFNKTLADSILVGVNLVDSIPSDTISGEVTPPIEKNASNAQSYYDLSGRCVMQPVKGGVYIQGGKKIVVR